MRMVRDMVIFGRGYFRSANICKASNYQMNNTAGMTHVNFFVDGLQEKEE
jgi:hypothetical protein